MESRELTWKERGNLWMRLGIRLIIAAVVLFLLFLVVPPLLSLFMPFVLALVLAWILNPLMRWLHNKFRLSRKISSLLIILVVFAVVGGLLALFIYEIGSEVYTLVTNWESVGQAIQSGLDTLGNRLEHIAALLPGQVISWIDGTYARLVAWLQEAVPEALSSLPKLPQSIIPTTKPIRLSFLLL